MRWSAACCTVGLGHAGSLGPGLPCHQGLGAEQGTGLHPPEASKDHGETQRGVETPEGRKEEQEPGPTRTTNRVVERRAQGGGQRELPWVS
jgi:hypothetical protein